MTIILIKLTDMKTTTLLFIYVCLFILSGVKLLAQTNIFPSTGSAGIGTTTPLASAALEMKSTSKGLLIPRMMKTQRDAVLVSTAAKGLLIYQTNSTPGFYYYDGSSWKSVSSSPGANTSLSNLVTTSVNQSLIPSSNNAVDIGSSTKNWRNAYVAGTLSAASVTASSGGANAAISGISTTNYGVYGSSGYLGVYGTGTHYGTYGFSQDSIGAVGASLGTSGNSYGVFGYNPNNIGVYGSGNIGVKGYSASAYDAVGVYGYCEYGYGILGESHGVTAIVFLGDVSVSGNIYQGSDKSLKQNIRNFSSAMDIINKLHATQYEFRQDGNYKLMNLPVGSHYGLIAQEVETVLPNLIKETKVDPAMATPRKPGEKNIAKDSAKSDVINFKALNYTELIPIMIKGMQELSSQNDSLKNENIVQEKVNAGLQNQINELKAMIVSNQSTVNSQQ